ncbi:MAG: cytidylate kinase family protein [Candidatus Korarchaeota archaeon]|nr:cytidylate kinase family protein [Candidatus Korarchaeota archaeon]
MGRKRFNVCLSGLTGSGKSTLARRLVERYGLKRVSGGDILKEIIGGKESLKDPGWWEREEASRAMAERMSNPELDMEVDRRLMSLASEGGYVLDSWTMAYLLDSEDCIKIFLKADLEVRALRVARRDRISFDEAVKRIKLKEEETYRIYKRIYGFELGKDLTPFHLVLDTTRLNASEVLSIVSKFIDSWLK